MVLRFESLQLPPSLFGHDRPYAPFQVALVALVGVLFAGVLYLSRVGTREKGLPPGPPTTPVLGNLLAIPPRYAHLKFMEWARQYGPVISLKLFGNNMIVLNDAASVKGFLDKQSRITSDRPPMHINDELISRGQHILLVNGQKNSFYRRLWNSVLAKERVGDHLPLQTAEGTAVLYNVLHNPDGFYTEMRRYSASLTLTIAYGKRAPTFDGVDESGFSVKDFYRLEHAFNFFLEVGAAPPLDLLPILKYLPESMASWKTMARKCRNDMKDLYLRRMYGELKKKMAMGIRTDCWMEKLIEKDTGLSEEALAWNGGVMMEGGSDTTSGALLTFVLCAVLHPHTLQKAWAELDEVVGEDRSPTIEDIDNLPYCYAFIREVMRWRPVAPAGVPHVSTKDDTFNGMFIPKGSVIVENTWAVLHDEELYDRPDEFIPERFLENEYGLKPGAPDKDMRNTFVYGAGRRICLGMHVAENSLKINIPKLLWAFTYTLKKDPSTGRPIPVSKDAFEPGHLTAPVPFQCEIKPRSKQIARTIEKEYQAVRPLLEKWEVSVPVE